MGTRKIILSGNKKIRQLNEEKNNKSREKKILKIIQGKCPGSNLGIKDSQNFDDKVIIFHKIQTDDDFIERECRGELNLR